MKKLSFIAGLFIILIALSGCPEESGYASLRNDPNPYSGTGPYDDPNTTYYNTGTGTENNDAVNCGYEDEPCCQQVGTDMFGMLTASNYCNEGLDCRLDTCVEGAEYQAYDRTRGYS